MANFTKNCDGCQHYGIDDNNINNSYCCKGICIKHVGDWHVEPIYWMHRGQTADVWGTLPDDVYQSFEQGECPWREDW